MIGRKTVRNAIGERLYIRMKRIVILKIITAIIIALTILSMAVLIVTPQTGLYEYLYEQQDLEASTGISVFEATLNYDSMVQQIMGRQEIIGMTTYSSSMDMQDKLEQLRKVYIGSRWMSGIGVVISILLLIFLRDRKWYESLNLGGLMAVGAAFLGVGVLWLLRPTRLFIFQSQYQEFFGYDSRFTGILPDQWALYSLFMGVAFVLFLGVVFGLIHLFARKDYHPHKF